MFKHKTPGIRSNSNNPATEEIRISAPWGGQVPLQAISRVYRHDRAIDLNHFLTERSRVHEVYIREQEKTKRLSLALSAVLLLAACFVVDFAPGGREYLAGGLGAALLVTAAGAASYKRIWGRSTGASLGADQGESGNEA